MNIAFGKIGKSTKFKTIGYSPTGGDCEPSAFIRALALHNPGDRFFLVGRSDFEQLDDAERRELFPHDNVVNIWEGVHVPTGKGGHVTDPARLRDHVSKWLADSRIHVDTAVIIFGQCPAASVYGFIQQRGNRNVITKTLNAGERYSGPLVHWLNESRAPYVEIINDPRYSSNALRDLFNSPAASLGQYDVTYHRGHIRSYEDQSLMTTMIRSRYAKMEVGFCFGRGAPAPLGPRRSKRFAIVLNEGADRAYSLPGVYKSRYEQVQLWVLSRFFSDAEIYGEWRHPVASRDPRFKGTRPLDELQQIFADVRYTLVIPIARGWVTGKYIEMLHAGVLPFFHWAYDEQQHVPIPEYLRVSNSVELQERITELDADPKKYHELWRASRALLKPEYYDGSYIAQTVRRELEAIHASRSA